MRTSKAQQTENQRTLIRAAVDLMTEQGFDGTTMKQIARAANLGDATIYKYFPSKEKLVFAYFEQAVASAITQMQATPAQQDFELQERMQLLIDSLLEILLTDREFVAIARALLDRSPLLMLMLSGDMPGKTALKTEFLALLTHAETSQEIVPCGFKPSLSSLLADYSFALVAYWLRDDSDNFGNTTQLIDLSLGVLVLALRSGLVDKAMDLGSFVVRSQLARLMQDGPGVLGLLQLARHGLTKPRS
jgi:TetR/AcrR family transcriptional regulator, regulator of autoinduction and epiphytic fitness